MQQKEVHPIDSYAGKRLREARKAAGFSQDALASKLEHPITFQQLQKYERGGNRLAISKLWEFAKALHVPPEYFFPSSDSQTVHCESLVEANLLHAFRHLTQKKQSALLALLEKADN